MAFLDDLRAFAVKVERVTDDTFVRTVEMTRDSIVEGSALTGAPGQPVKTGNLKGSWQTEFESKDIAVISTNVEYAEAIEDGVGRFGPLTLRSAVGGWHSVKQTIANHDRIVEAAVAEITGNGGGV